MIIDIDLIAKIISESQNSFRSEILKELKGFIKIGPLSTYRINGAIETFELNEKIQADQKKIVVIGYSELLECLARQKMDGVSHQLMITGEKFGYLLFADFKKPVLHGVLKFLHQKIERKTELDEHNTLKGTWTNNSFYLRGNKLKNKSL